MAGQDHLFNWVERAAEFATDELEGMTVRIEVDPQADRRRSFGRLLVYVYVDGENFNERLLADGYARLYDSSFSLQAEFKRPRHERKRTTSACGGSRGPARLPRRLSRSCPPVVTARTSPTPPADGDYNCSRFDTPAKAQYVLENTPDDPHRLDDDDDGDACESLP